MRGPIDFIVVAFEGNKFDGSILKELDKAVVAGTIAVLGLSLIAKDENGDVAAIEVADTSDEVVHLLASAKQAGGENLIDPSDVEEVADLLEPNTSAGLLVVEQLWAKGLKQAIIDAKGTLISEGRIHPEAYAELDAKEEN